MDVRAQGQGAKKAVARERKPVPVFPDRPHAFGAATLLVPEAPVQTSWPSLEFEAQVMDAGNRAFRAQECANRKRAMAGRGIRFEEAGPKRARRLMASREKTSALTENLAPAEERTTTTSELVQGARKANLTLTISERRTDWMRRKGLRYVTCSLVMTRRKRESQNQNANGERSSIKPPSQSLCLKATSMPSASGTGRKTKGV